MSVVKSKIEILEFLWKTLDIWEEGLDEFQVRFCVNSGKTECW